MSKWFPVCRVCGCDIPHLVCPDAIRLCNGCIHKEAIEQEEAFMAALQTEQDIEDCPELFTQEEKGTNRKFLDECYKTDYDD